MLRPIAIIAIVAAFAAAVPVAFAGSLPSPGTGTISVFVPGSGAATTQPVYQGSVAFNTTGTKGLKNPRVAVACYQNGALVYAEAGGAGDTLKLGGDMSQWVLNGGGSASCTASLFYIVNSSGTGEWNG